MIESALSWVGQLAEFFGSFVPRPIVIQASHRGVKYVRGRTATLLEPGVHVSWPAFSPIETCAVVRQTLDAPARLLETADGESVVASGIVEYEIDDPIAFLAETENGYESIQNVASASIREVVLDSTRAELRELDGPTDRLLALTLGEDLAPYGVKVLRARVADFSRVRPIHLTGEVKLGGAARHFDES